MKKVIIFDDDEDIQIIFNYFLKGEGWQVITYPNCNEVLERVTMVQPDVIIMDNWIPDSGGIIATQKLKKSEVHKNIPVVYFTAKFVAVCDLTDEMAALVGVLPYITFSRLTG